MCITRSIAEAIISDHRYGAFATRNREAIFKRARLNLTPEHFSRIPQELTMRRLIEVKGREIVILDIEKLRNYES